jgi:hypothetical protein
MKSAASLQARARKRLAELRKRRKDPRFLRVMGRFMHEGLLVTNEDIKPYEEPLEVSEVLWAGMVEPRLLELLPALLVKRPGLFRKVDELPADLAEVVRKLRRDQEPENFRGIAGSDVHGWLRRVGRRGQAPSLLKSFRFKPEDQRLLKTLSEQYEISETEVIRRALRSLT